VGGIRRTQCSGALDVWTMVISAKRNKAAQVRNILRVCSL
jgi:hypothetical protein